MQRFPTWGTRKIYRSTPDFHQKKIYTKIFNGNAIKSLYYGVREVFFLFGGTRAEKGRELLVQWLQIDPKQINFEADYIS